MSWQGFWRRGDEQQRFLNLGFWASRISVMKGNDGLCRQLDFAGDGVHAPNMCVGDGDKKKGEGRITSLREWIFFFNFVFLLIFK